MNPKKTTHRERERARVKDIETERERARARETDIETEREIDRDRERELNVKKKDSSMFFSVGEGYCITIIVYYNIVSLSTK